MSPPGFLAKNRLGKLGLDRGLQVAGVVIGILFLIVTMVLPLYAILSKSVENKDGEFVGLANYLEYASNPSLLNSISNSFTIAIVTTVIVISLALLTAYALTRT